jgi:hypothetical protein
MPVPDHAVLHYAAQNASAIAGVAVLASAANLQAHRGIRPWWLVRGLAQMAKHHIVGPMLQPLTKAVMTRLHGFSTRFTVDELIHSWQRASTLDFETHKKICLTLHAANVPVLAAWTEDDHLIETAVAEQMANALPSGPRLNFRTGGHMLVKSRAKEVSHAMAQWMGI